MRLWVTFEFNLIMKITVIKTGFVKLSPAVVPWDSKLKTKKKKMHLSYLMEK